MKIWRMRIAYWLRKTTNTQVVSYLLFFHCNNGCTKALNVTLYVHCCLVNIACTVHRMMNFCVEPAVRALNALYTRHQFSNMFRHPTRAIITES